MKTKDFTASDTNSIKSVVGFQPDFIHIGTGGTISLHIQKDDGSTDDVPIVVTSGYDWPADNVIRVNATGTTAANFAAWQE